MSNKIVYTFLLLFTFLWSCKKDDKFYDGKSLVSFSQSNISINIPFTQNADFTISIPIQIDSKVENSDKQIYIYEESLQKAVNGNNYFLISDTSIIKKDSVYSSFKLVLKPSHFYENQKITLIFKIADNSEIKPSENYKTCIVTIYKQPFLSVFTGSYMCYEPINQDTYKTTFVATSKSNTIANTNFWNFSPEGQPIYYTIKKDSARSIEIEEQTWIDKSGITYKVSGKGNYTFDGKMTVNYTLIASDTVYETGIHYFTPFNE